MALTISKLKMWKDPGYTRNCADVPPAGSLKLPAVPDYSLAASETLRPHKDSTLTELHLPLSFTQTFGMSYLYIEATDGAGTVKLFGWITSIEQRSTSAEGVTIKWDVDWWRSYSGDADLRTGMIVKCPNATYKRPYRTQPRYWRIKQDYKIRTQNVTSTNILDCLWVYVFIVCNKIVSGNVTNIVTESSILFAPAYAAFKTDPSSATYTGMPIDDLYGGTLDEWVNNYLSAANESAKIIGAWLAPVGPANFTYDYNTRLWTGDGTGFTLKGSSTPSASHMMQLDQTATLDTRFNINIGGGRIDELNKICITDFEGNILGYAPYGLYFAGVKGMLDIGPNGGYLYVRFVFAGETDSVLYIAGEDNPYDTIDEENRKHFAPSLGCGFSIPLPAVPVNENQWSDYMYAGQRDFDITNARIANDKQAISGLESSVSSAIGGGVTGASAGPVGAVAGLIGGGAVSAGMTGINYLLGENFNKQLQDATDRLYANQKNGIALNGGSKSKILLADCYYPLILVMEPDATSKAEYNSDISVNGYDTDIAVTSVTTFITGTTGPYRVINMTVCGNIPPQAKQYIKDKFAAGIRIIENNPTGVAP